MLWLCLGPALSAVAGGGDVTLRLSTQLSYDDNLFRLPADADLAARGVSKRSDQVTVLGLGVEAQLPVSQQRFVLSLQGNDVRYQTARFLNYRGGNLSANWLWRSGKRASGSLGLQREKVLSDFVDVGGTSRNLRTRTSVNATGRYWLYPDWWLTAGFEDIGVSNDAVRTSNRDDRAFSFGVEYRTKADNSIWFQLRRTRGEAPNEVETPSLIYDNDFTQTDVETLLDWRMNGFFRSRARIGYTQRRHADFSDRDFSGLTGHWSQDWFATDKLAVNVTARREIGSYQDVTSNYVETRALSLSPVWSLTQKLRLQAALELRKRNFDGDPNIVSSAGSRRREDINSFSVSALYAPRDNIDLSVSLRRQQRDASSANFDFEATTLDARLSVGF